MKMQYATPLSQMQLVTSWDYEYANIYKCFHINMEFPGFHQTQITHSFELLTVITSSGNKYRAKKLIESSSFELKADLSMMQISSVTPLSPRWIFVIVRLKMNFGIEYKADVIHTPAITICKCKFSNKTQ